MRLVIFILMVLGWNLPPVTGAEKPAVHETSESLIFRSNGAPARAGPGAQNDFLHVIIDLPLVGGDRGGDQGLPSTGPGPGEHPLKVDLDQPVIGDPRNSQDQAFPRGGFQGSLLWYMIDPPNIGDPRIPWVSLELVEGRNVFRSPNPPGNQLLPGDRRDDPFQAVRRGTGKQNRLSPNPPGNQLLPGDRGDDPFQAVRRGGNQDARKGPVPPGNIFTQDLRPPGASLFSFDVQAATGDRNVKGIEFDGFNFWITGSSDFTKAFLYKLSPQGVLVNLYPQPLANWGGEGWRDLAYDGRYLYAGDGRAAPGMITQIDPFSGLTTGVYIPVPLVVVEALAYDPLHDSFWTASAAGRIYNVARDGSVLADFPAPFSGIITGLAMESSAGHGRVLWAWSHDGAGTVRAFAVDPGTGVLAGPSFQDAIPLGGASCGACAFNDADGSGRWILAAVLHGPNTSHARGFGLAEADPLSEQEYYGAAAAGSLGYPEIAFETPYIHSKAVLKLTSSSAFPETGIVLVGPAPGYVPLGGGHALLVAVQSVIPVALQPGVTEIQGMAGAPLWFTKTYWQLFQTDPNGVLLISNAPMAASRGLRMYLGGPDH